MRVSCGFMIRRVVHVLYIYLHIYVHAYQLAPLSQLRRFLFVRFSLRESSFLSFGVCIHCVFFRAVFLFQERLSAFDGSVRQIHLEERDLPLAVGTFASGAGGGPSPTGGGGGGGGCGGGGSPPCRLNAWGRSDRIRPAVPFGGGNRSHSHSIPICHTSHSFPICHTSHSLPYVTLSHSFPICHTCHSLPHISEILCF